MQHDKIIERLEYFLSDYDKPVKITEGYWFNQKETLNQITLYIFSKFKTGDKDSMGNKKYFFNIVNPACRNATKNIDIDTGNIFIKDMSGKNRVKSLVASELLKEYMRKEHISTLLNSLSTDLPIYGSVIWKNDKDDVTQLKIENIMFDPGLNSVRKTFDIRSGYVIEKLYFQPWELDEMTSKGWDKEMVEETTEEFRKQDKAGSEILVYEIHAEFKNEYFGNGDGYSFYRVFISACEKNRVLFHNKEKKMPYKKVDYVRITGRSLGMGEPEGLFDPQIRMNVMKNEKAVSMQLGSKTVFWTGDDVIERNIMQDTLNGDIIKTKSGLNAVNTDTRNLGAYGQEENSWMGQSRLLSNTLEALTGEQLATNTPFKSFNKMNAEGTKFFAYVRENMGLFIRESFKEWLLPRFEAYIKKNVGEVFEIVNPDVIMVLQEELITKKVGKFMKERVLQNGMFPTPQEIEQFKTDEMSKLGRTIMQEIEDELLDFEHDLDIIVTGEQEVDNLENKINLIQSLSQNAIALQDPTIKSIVDSAAEDMGINYNVFNLYKANPQAQPTTNQRLDLGGATNINQIAGNDGQNNA